MPVTQNLQGHTPHDRLSYLLDRLCSELDANNASSGTGSVTALSLAQQAKAVIDGYDVYVERMSSPHPPMLDVMIAEGNKKDWDAIHREGKTMFRLFPQMSAGAYEAVVLQQLAKLAKVCRLPCT